MRKNVHLSLGIKWIGPDIDNLILHTEYLLEQMEASPYKREIPLHWLIANSPYLEARHKKLDSLLLEIKTRIQTLNDVAVATGYSGACFPQLTLDELEKELSWASSNPWNSGLKDFFGKAPRILIPQVVDGQNPAVLSLYEQCGYTAIGGDSYFLPPEDKTYFPCQQLTPATTLTGLKKNLKSRLQQKKQFLLLIIPLHAGWEPDTLAAAWQIFLKTIAWLQSKYAFAFSRADQAIPVQGIPGNSATYYPDNSINGRYLMLKIDRYRKKANKQDKDYKAVLEALHQSGVETTCPTGKIAAFPPTDRLHDCTMQGNTILTGTQFSANFINGKLNNVTDKYGRFILHGEPARSYTQIAGIMYPFENISSASVGGKYTRGLRELLKIEPPACLQEGSQLTDYIFSEDFPYLMVSSRLRYPSFPLDTVLDKIVPFEFPLYNLDKTGKAEVISFTAQHIQKYTLTQATPLMTLLGSLFVFPCGGTHLLVGFPPNKNQTLGRITLRLCRENKQPIVQLAICGTYQPTTARDYNKAAELFSFYIGVEESIPESLPYFPAKVLKEIPEHEILWE